jgi:hypothetical protein
MQIHMVRTDATESGAEAFAVNPLHHWLQCDTCWKQLRFWQFRRLESVAGFAIRQSIEAIVEDGRSRPEDIFPKKARKLLMTDMVNAIFGCWTSNSRKAVLPVVEQLQSLLFYPLQFEGNEASPNIIYCGGGA